MQQGQGLARSGSRHPCQGPCLLKKQACSCFFRNASVLKRPCPCELECPLLVLIHLCEGGDPLVGGRASGSPRGWQRLLIWCMGCDPCLELMQGGRLKACQARLCARETVWALYGVLRLCVVDLHRDVVDQSSLLESPFWGCPPAVHLPGRDLRGVWPPPYGLERAYVRGCTSILVWLGVCLHSRPRDAVKARCEDDPDAP